VEVVFLLGSIFRSAVPEICNSKQIRTVTSLYIFTCLFTLDY
jgi:hypothetical protein